MFFVCFIDVTKWLILYDLIQNQSQGYTMINNSIGGLLNISCAAPSPASSLTWYQSKPWIFVLISMGGAILISIFIWWDRAIIICTYDAVNSWIYHNYKLRLFHTCLAILYNLVTCLTAYLSPSQGGSLSQWPPASALADAHQHAEEDQRPASRRDCFHRCDWHPGRQSLRNIVSHGIRSSSSSVFQACSKYCTVMKMHI